MATGATYEKVAREGDKREDAIGIFLFFGNFYLQRMGGCALNLMHAVHNSTTTLFITIFVLTFTHYVGGIMWFTCGL